MTQALIIFPVYNEERILEENLIRLRDYMGEQLDLPHRFIIADSNSTDSTRSIAEGLAGRYDNVSYVNIDTSGKGGKMKAITTEYDAEVFAFIDADLPIELERFVEIVTTVAKGDGDVCIASKYAEGGKSNRPLMRVIASRIYIGLFRLLAGIRTTDVGAGAKAWGRRAKDEVWPLVLDESWFFDAELLYYSAKHGLRIKEVAVTYDDQRGDSKLNLFSDSIYMGRKLIALVLRNLLSKEKK